MSEHAAIAAVFDRSAPTYDSVIPFFRTFGQMLVDLADIREGDRVLDVAAGRGATAFPAAERGAFVVATDLGVEMIRRLRGDIPRSAAPDDVTALVGDACRLPFNARFDVVLCGFLLHILPEPEAAAMELFRCLRPGGRCAVSVPTGAGEDWNFYGDILKRHAGAAARPLEPWPPPRDLARVLGDSGFENVTVTDRTHTFIFEGPDAWWQWVWSQGMRAPLEHFEGDALASVKKDMLEAVARLDTGAGILLPQSVRSITASKPIH